MEQSQEQDNENMYDWVMAVHKLGWNNVDPPCDHNRCLWLDAIDLVAYLQLTNAVCSDQWPALSPAVFIIRAAMDARPQAYREFEANHLIVGELLPLEFGWEGTKIYDERLEVYRRILKETHPNPSPIYFENGDIADKLTFRTSTFQKIRPEDNSTSITDWYYKTICEFGGQLDLEHPQNNYSLWNNKVYTNVKPHWMWGLVDLLEKYCGWAFGTKGMSRSMACYPNIRFVESDFCDRRSTSGEFEYNKIKDDMKDLSLSPNKGDRASGELV